MKANKTHRQKMAQALRTADRRQSYNIYDIIGATAAALFLAAVFLLAGHLETVTQY